VLLLAVGVARAGGAGAVEGHVVDADGNAAKGVTVTAHCVSTSEWVEVAVRTDESGAFRLEGLAAGRYVLMLTHEVEKPKLPGGAAGEFAKALGDAVGEVFRKATHDMLVKSAEKNPHRVDVEAGKTAVHDFRLARQLAVTLVLPRDGEPCAGAEVRLYPLEIRGETIPRRSAERSRPRTDAKGSISFDAVAEGIYAVIVEIGDWCVDCGRVTVEGTGPLRLPVVLGSHEIRLRVVDSKGNPVKKAEPGAAGPEEWVGVQRKAFADDIESKDGVYRIPYVGEGRYQAYLNTGTVYAAASPVEILPGSGDPDVLAKIPPTGRVVVRVLDAAGKPVRKAHVSLEHPSGTPAWGQEVRRNGEIAFDYVGTGPWRVGLQGEGSELTDVRDITVEESKEVVVELTAK